MPRLGEASVSPRCLCRELPRDFLTVWTDQTTASLFPPPSHHIQPRGLLQWPLLSLSTRLHPSSPYCCGDPVLVTLDAIWWDCQSRLWGGRQGAG